MDQDPKRRSKSLDVSGLDDVLAELNELAQKAEKERLASRAKVDLRRSKTSAQEHRAKVEATYKVTQGEMLVLLIANVNSDSN